MKLGILHETKVPADRRSPLSPGQLRDLKQAFPDVEFLVQHSDLREFRDQEFIQKGIKVAGDLSMCDILLGVKEVDVDTLLPGKTYMFFSHTAKMQPHNQKLLMKMAELGITLIDYEYLKKDSERIAAFGRWAGIAGAYTALQGAGEITKRFSLEPASDLNTIDDLQKQLQNLNLPEDFKAVITGEGRVAGGALEILEKAGFHKTEPDEFINGLISGRIYCQLGPQHYYDRPGMVTFDHHHFKEHGEDYRADLFKYVQHIDILIAGHFWDGKSPVLLTLEQLRQLVPGLTLIADISCDINGLIASTVRPSTIESPFYGFDPETGREIAPFTEDKITVMAVDNLPAMLPRESSVDFGNDLMSDVLPELLNKKSSAMIDNATILRDGRLTPYFQYLQDYLEGKLSIE